MKLGIFAKKYSSYVFARKPKTAIHNTATDEILSLLDSEIDVNELTTEMFDNVLSILKERHKSSYSANSRLGTFLRLWDFGKWDNYVLPCKINYLQPTPEEVLERQQAWQATLAKWDDEKVRSRKYRERAKKKKLEAQKLLKDEEISKEPEEQEDEVLTPEELVPDDDDVYED